jgi:hypothetical protein
MGSMSEMGGEYDDLSEMGGKPNDLSEMRGKRVGELNDLSEILCS